MISNSLGAHRFRQPEPEIIKCPSCSQEVEIWTDEVSVSCPHCNIAIFREEGQSCLDWCRYAKECVGDQLYSKYMQNKTITLKQKLLKELEDYFGTDTKRINHAKNVMHFAEELLKQEKADWYIVIPAAILHDVGIKVAEEKYGSSAGHYQEKEGPAIAKSILLRFGFRKEDIDEICNIIAHHHSPGKINTQNFKLLYDADWLVNFAESSYLKKDDSASRCATSKESCVREKDELDLKDRDKLGRAINRVFQTEAGKRLAQKLYLK